MKKKIEKDLITPVGRIQDEVVAPELSQYDKDFKTDILDTMQKNYRATLIAYRRKLHGSVNYFDPNTILSKLNTGSQIVVLDSMKELPGDWRDIDLTSFLPEGEAIERELISPEDDLASEVASSEDGDNGTSDDGGTATSKDDLHDPFIAIEESFASL